MKKTNSHKIIFRALFLLVSCLSATALQAKNVIMKDLTLGLRTDVKQAVLKPVSTVGVYPIAENSVDAERIDIRRNSQSSLRPTRAAAVSNANVQQAPAQSKAITAAMILSIERRLANACTPSSNPSISGPLASLGGLVPGHLVVNALKVKYGIVVHGNVKTVVVTPPPHGTVAPIGIDDQTFPKSPFEIFEYTPDKDFLGEDKVAFKVIIDGKTFRVSYKVMVVHGDFDWACHTDAKDRGAIEPTLEFALEELRPDFDANDSTSPTTSQVEQETQFVYWLLTSSESVSVDFENLPNGSVGQATGTNITLDTNAAGHGWFIDTTPDNNDEFLSTSDPNVWIARAGSAADGKMDMLSVLLHEYGHVLGLDHSGDNDDAMAVVLQPGVRKLWSETDLAKLNEIRYLAYQSSPLPDTVPFGGSTDGLPLGQNS